MKLSYVLDVTWTCLFYECFFGRVRKLLNFVMIGEGQAGVRSCPEDVGSHFGPNMGQLELPKRVMLQLFSIFSLVVIISNLRPSRKQT